MQFARWNNAGENDNEYINEYENEYSQIPHAVRQMQIAAIAAF